MGYRDEPVGAGRRLTGSSSGCHRVSDNTGRRKPWLALFTLIAALGAIMLWTVKPNSAFIIHALFWIALANFAFEMGMVFL